MATGTRRPGEFCWTNMLTPQPAEAREFFGRILGWEYFEIPGLGHGVRVGGHDVGAIFDLEGPNTPPGTRPHIGALLKVESADATCEKVVSLGGRVRPAFDIMNQGRMAVSNDPNGAEFDIWEPKNFHGTDVDSAMHGAPSWFETMTTDVGRATEFYSELLGWTPHPMRMSGSEYTTFMIGDDPVGGLMQIPTEVVGLKPHWATYFTVDDPDLAAAEAMRLGARLHLPLQDIPGIGRFCGITSPQGVQFYTIKYGR